MLATALDHIEMSRALTRQRRAVFSNALFHRLGLRPGGWKVAIMTIMLGIAVTSLKARGAEAPVPTTEIAVNDFTRDRTLFDSGVAVGLNQASIPISGTATPGEVIEGRIVSEGGFLADWEVWATAAPDGTWSTTLSSERSAHWMRVEARVQSEPFVRSYTSNRFGVGHVIALWGQSEVVRLRSLAHDSLTPETLLADDQVQAMWFDGAPVVKHLSAIDPHSSALAAMANVLISERPADKFAIVFQAVAGTGFRELVDDSNAGRDWADDAVLHSFATADGQHVGLPAVSWFASPGALGANYEDALFPLFTGKTATGAAVTFPAQITYGNGASYTADHWFGELYDLSRTRWIAYGPHRFDIGADMQSATVLATGGVQNNLTNKQLARESWREMLENPHAAGVFLPAGLEPLTYQNGVSDGQGGWIDYSHPAGSTDDGAPMLARLTAHAILQAADLVDWDVPNFDMAFWEPSGAYVEVWSTAGPITTIRQSRSETALDNSHPHWTDVLGWQINGAPAERAEIVAGRVRIFPNQGVFVPSDVIDFGEGGSTGMVKFPQDYYAQTYKDLPIVDVGADLVEGISVRPLPEMSVLTNTLTGQASEFVTSSTGPHFIDPNPLGSGVGQFQLRADFAPVLPSSGSQIIATTTGNYLKLEAMPDGALRLRVRDDAGVILLSNATTNAGVLIDTVQAELVLAVDLVSGFARIWVNDNLVFDQSFSSTSNLLPSNRILLLLASFSGGLQVEGSFTKLSVWKDATSDGSLPASAPYKEFSGPPGLVNSDPWKNGADAI
jgi:hypothetical protein